MRLNKKGMTLVELIISIALISIVLGFLFKVILDVKYERDNPNYAVNNQINRSEIIKTIQEDVLKLNLTKVDFLSLSKKVRLKFSTGGYRIIEISDNNKSLKYYGSDFEKRTWNIVDDNYEFGEIKYEYFNGDNSFVLSLVIPIENSINNESLTIDDIMILVEAH